MADIFDKAILVGMGLEKKAKEVLEELQKSGKTETEAEGGEVPPKQAVENKVVEEGVSVLRELISAARGVKEKIEGDVTGATEKIFDRMGVPNADDIEVIKEMARVSREKVDALEKRVAELEKALAEKK